PEKPNPALDHVVPEGRDCRTTRRHSVVGEPPAQDLGKPLTLPLDPVVSHRQQASLDFPQLGAHALSTRLPSENEAATIPAVRAIVREPKEVERLRVAETPSASVYLDGKTVSRVAGQRWGIFGGRGCQRLL